MHWPFKQWTGTLMDISMHLVSTIIQTKSSGGLRPPGRPRKSPRVRTCRPVPSVDPICAQHTT
eukprot:9984-Alexandrium_andersonii.AAC.1